MMHKCKSRVVVVVLALAGGAAADEIFWVGYQNDCMDDHPDVGSFFHDDNWLNFAVPGVNDEAKFGTGFDPQENGVRPHHIHFGDFCLDVFDCPDEIPVPGGAVTNLRLIIQDDTWIFDFATGSVGDCELPGSNTGSYTLTEFVIVGDTIETTGLPGNAQLTIQNGTVTSTWSTIGEDLDASGHVIVNGIDSQWIQTSNMRVGWLGDGTLTIQNGGHVENTWTNIAEQADSAGAAIVTGGGTTWTHSEALAVGVAGNGTLNVSDGAAVSNTWSHIGRELGGSGDAIVTGSGTTWNSSEFLIVGVVGNGTLSVSDGAVVSNTLSTIGDQLSGSGNVTVDGIDSQWIQAADMRVGWFGDGTLTIQNGGHVENTWTNIGEQADSTGAAIVTGTGTTWVQSDRLIVGVLGNGTLSVLDGAVVSNTWSAIGNELSGSGDVIVDGVDSQWIQSANMFVGWFGDGTLNIQNGGHVENTWTDIASRADSRGTAIVTGAGTNWTQSDRLIVGVLGNGALSVLDGAVVSSTLSTIGEQLSGSGEVMVDGVDSQWIQSADMRVGWFGDGTLTIQNGGHVSNTWTDIGQQAEGVGTAIVTGTGTTWTHSEALAVGVVGHGTLTVSDGAAVSNTWSHIGRELGSSGDAIVFGSGTTWNCSEFLIAGVFGHGALSVNDGAVVSNTWSTIGEQLSGSGEVMVDGVDSQWIQSEAMIIGWFGDGTLTIQNGGHVENTFANIAWQAEGVGAATVTGGGSTWTHSGALVVGRFGNGTLSVNDGAVVSNTWSQIGRELSGSGDVIVTGVGTTWTNSLRLVVGVLGNGRLSVLDGAVVSNTWSSIGKELGGSGEVMVDGVASHWNQSADMRVGNFGDGTLTIQNGGQVSNTFTNIAWQAEGVGAATVTGAGSTWSHSLSLVVGRAGNGTLSISDGAVVSNTWARIGWEVGGAGDAVVDGLGTRWLCDNFLIVGAEGEGELTVSGGGWLDTSEDAPNAVGAIIGQASTGIGEVTVTGSDSRWTCTHQMQVGRLGRGTLTVSDGASLDIAVLNPNSNPAALLVARDTGSVGDVEVTGVGSEITMDNHLRVGARVNTLGTVTISAGASMDLGGSGGNAGLGLIGFAAGSDGVLTVTGSTYTSVAQLQVGREGVGWLTIAEGGHVVTAKSTSPTNSSGIVGTLAGSTGTTRVTGAGSLWEQDGGMSVGFSSFGNLTVEAGGAIHSVDGYVARLEGSGGVAAITGTGSVWEVSDSFYVGGDDLAEGGPANLTIANDGALVIGDTLRLWNSGTLTLVGGSVTVGAGPVETAPDLVRLHEDGTLTGIGGMLGNVISNGTVAPGASAGGLSIDGDYTQDVAGVLEIEIGGVGPGTEFDQLEVTGHAALDGTLRIILIRNFEPTLGDRFEILTYASHTGDFSELIGVDLGDGLLLKLVFGPVGLTLVVIEDCNENGIDDHIDIAEGTSDDCDGDGRPDECQISRDFGEGFFCDENCDEDCNENGVPDSCDIAEGTSDDCDGNGRPDECQISRDFGEGFFCDADCDEDCNENGIPDVCDIDDCPAEDPDCNDCNANLRPDVCDIEDGTSDDLDGNGIPDECVGWDGDSDVRWSNSENWATGDVPGDEGPGPVESVVLDLSLDPPNRDVELDISVSIDSLVIEDAMTLTMSGGDLHIDAANGIVANDALSIGDGLSIIADADIFLRGAHPITLMGDTASISSSLAEHVVTNLGTVNGRGRFAAALRNRGIIRADDPEGALVIADEMFPKINQGILRADAGGRLVIETNITGTGNLATDGGVISIPSLDRAVTVAGGTLTIDDVDGLGGAGLEVDRDTSVLLTGDVLIVRGRYGPAPGAEDVSASLSARSLIIQGDADGSQPGEMTLSGDMRVDVADDLLLDGELTGSCSSDGNDTPPILRTSGLVRLNIGRDIRIVQSVDVQIGEQSVMSAGGDFDNRSIWAICFDWPGRLELDGVELQRFEVAGEDRGADLAGFDDNFAMGTLELAPNATVRLTDGFDNQNDDGSPCDEVLYVDTLIVGEGATIEEDSCILYYRTLDNRGGNLPGLGTRILRICVRDPEWLCDGDVDGDGQVNPVDSGLVQAAFGSTDEQDLCQYDVDCDGQINPVDSGIVQSLFGTCDAPRNVCP